MSTLGAKVWKDDVVDKRCCAMLVTVCCNRTTNLNWWIIDMILVEDGRFKKGGSRKDVTRDSRKQQQANNGFILYMCAIMYLRSCL